MKNPERLVATQRGLGLTLLQAGDRRHQPPEGLLERTLTHVGVAGAVATSISTQAAAQVMSGLGTAADTGLVTTTTSLAAVFCKAVAIGGGIGAITMATSMGVDHLSSPARSEPASTSSISSGRPTAAAQYRANRSAAASTLPVASVELAGVGRPSRATTPVGATTLDMPADSASLAAEAKLMSQAQSALEQGNREAALDILEQHRLEFPTGQLKPEATLLRARAFKLKHSDPPSGP